MWSCCSYCGNYSSKAEVAESAPIPFGSKFPVMRGMLTLQSMSTTGRVGSKEWGLLKGGLSPATVDSTELLALGTWMRISGSCFTISPCTTIPFKTPLILAQLQPRLTTRMLKSIFSYIITEIPWKTSPSAPPPQNGVTAAFFSQTYPL